MTGSVSFAHKYGVTGDKNSAAASRVQADFERVAVNKRLIGHNDDDELHMLLRAAAAAARDSKFKYIFSIYKILV